MKLRDRGIADSSAATMRAVRDAEAAAGDPITGAFLAVNGTIEEHLTLASAVGTTARAQMALIRSHRDPTVLDVLAGRDDLNHDVGDALVDAGHEYKAPAWMFRPTAAAQIAHAVRSGRRLGPELKELASVDSRTLDLIFERADQALDRAFVWDLLCHREAHPSWARRALANEFGNVARRRAWSSPHLPPADLHAEFEAATESRSVRRLEILARNPALASHAERLIEIASEETAAAGSPGDTWMRVLEPLASNPDAPPDVLVRLAGVQQLTVAVLRNPAASDPAVFGNVPSAHVHGTDAGVVRYLTSRFGTDQDDWALAVALLDDWNSTLSDLADTTTALNALQHRRSTSFGLPRGSRGES